MKKITVLIPCHNEEEGIGRVLERIPTDRLFHLGYVTEVIVINNRSTDQTEYIARDKQAMVIQEPKKGKGNAIKAGFNALGGDTSYVVMLDGDNTYDAQEIPSLIEPL